MNVVAGSLFSGIGMLDYGLHLAGIEHAWFCESDPWRRGILAQRWPGVPIFDDVRAVDGSAPRVDLLVGGFPCRGASTAGNRTGLDHPETALWWEMARVIRLLRPRLVLIENVANLLTVPPAAPGRAWGEVLGELASLGYVVAWDCLPAAAFGAPHLRDRVFAVAALADATGRAEGAELATGEERPGRTSAEPCPAPDASEGGRRAVERDLLPGESDPARLATADSNRHALRKQPESERGGGGSAEPGIAAPDLHGGQLPAGRDGGGEHGLQAHSRRATPEWRAYAGAIARWEEVAGPAPEPLLRGLDARDARKVVRSRLSALGDGVQAQAGYFLGRRILDFERDGLKPAGISGGGASQMTVDDVIADIEGVGDEGA